MEKTLDREQLFFFKTLFEMRSLMAAANALGLPAATASRMLGKLRQAFDDELFTRCATGLTPNWRAEAAYPKVLALLDGYEHLLEKRVFTPRDLRCVFRVACVDHAMLFMAPGFSKVTEEAPNVSVDIVPIEDDWQLRLRRGDIDAVVNPFEDFPADFHSLVLRKDVKNCVVVRPGHPLEKLREQKGVLSFDDLLPYGFVEVSYSPASCYRRAKHEEGDRLARRRIAVRVPYFFGAARLVSSSNFIAVMSDVMCEWLVPKDFVHVLPLESLPELSTFSPRLIWHERSHSDPAMQWFRSVLSESCREGVAKNVTLSAR